MFHAIVALLVLVASSPPCFAEPGPPRPADKGRASLWRDSWPTFSGVEGAATVAAGVGTLALVLRGPAETERWSGGVLFDDAVRDGLRLDSADARQQVRSLGNLPYYAAGVIPLLVDPLAVALVGHDDPKAAANLALISLEAFSYTGLLSFAATRTFARERPDSRACRKERVDGRDCEVDTESFWSGHTSIAATSAGLVCANHSYLALWKYPLLDAGACALSAAGAVATGLSRVLSDRHYASDVLVGGAVGFGVGYAVPVLLHYTREQGELTVSFRNTPPCDEGCAVVGGRF